MKQFSLQVAPRSKSGRGPARRARRDGHIPAILYGKAADPQMLSINTPEFSALVKSVAGSAAVIELHEEGADKRLSVLQEVQRDPLTDKVLHIDFHEISANETIELDIPVHTKGESEGVKNENGILETVSHELRIRCLPNDLPSFIEVDVTELRVGQSIHVSDLAAIPGVEFLDDEDQSVVACVEAVEEVEPVVAEVAVPGAPAAEGDAAAESAEGESEKESSGESETEKKE